MAILGHVGLYFQFSTKTLLYLCGFLVIFYCLYIYNVYFVKIIRRKRFYEKRHI